MISRLLNIILIGLKRNDMPSTVALQALFMTWLSLPAISITHTLSTSGDFSPYTEKILPGGGIDHSLLPSSSINQTWRVRIVPTFHGSQLVAKKFYPLNAGKDSIEIETLRFYLSNPRLMYHNREVFELPQKYYLMDIADTASLSLQWTLPKTIAFDQIAFEIGVDSLTQSGGAHGAALDPSNGMYWSWQSGYIHVKLEGKATSSPLRDKAFQYHLGGFQAPFGAIASVVLPLDRDKEIRIGIALETFFEHIALTEKPEIMRPCKEAVMAIHHFAAAFNIMP